MSRTEYAHDNAPNCPHCETDVYVCARTSPRAGEWRCEFCGWEFRADEPERFIASDGDTEIDDAQESEKQPEDGAGTSASGSPRHDDSYSTRSDNSTDRVGRRTGLRAHDGHASWREVAWRCHVEPGR